MRNGSDYACPVLAVKVLDSSGMMFIPSLERCKVTYLITDTYISCRMTAASIVIAVAGFRWRCSQYLPYRNLHF